MTQTLAGRGAENLVPSHWGFNSPVPTPLALAALVAVPLVLGVWYWRRLAQLPAATRAVVTGLRTFALFLLIFLALDPSIVARLVKPGEQFVILLFDDSRSMRIGGAEGRARGDRLIEAYAAARDSFEDALKQRHRVVKYRIGEMLTPLDTVESLTFAARESRLVGGVQQVLRDFEGTTVSAVVLFSDGVEQAGEEAQTANDLGANVPVFTVGADSDSAWHDLELSRLAVRRTDFDKSPVEVVIGVGAAGLQGREAQVEVMLGSRSVAARTVRLGEDGEEQQVRLSFVPDRPGWVEYSAQVKLLSNSAEDPAALDRIVENNSRRFLVDNRDTQYRILYVSGRPNWENKFVGRALDGDKELNMASLILISNAERKFEFRGSRTTLANPLFEGFTDEEDRPRYDEAVYLRLNVPQGELVNGFPDEAKELFAYDLVIWGNLERDVLTNLQLELTRSFVERRGGSLLLLGGETAFGPRGYAGTVIENMLPVVMNPDAAQAADARAREIYRVQPTMEGLLQGAWAFDEDEIANQRLWEEMPELYGLDRFTLVRAGATIMATVQSDDPEVNGRPLYAVQRYGEGRTSILATSNTWQWQMRLDSENDRHGRFWRQLMRSLVHGVPKPVVWRAKADRYPREAEARFEFVVRDDLFEYREGLQTVVAVESPTGAAEVLPVEESIEESGVYAADLLPTEVGLHKLTLTAENAKGEVVGRLEEAFLVEDDRREFQNAQYDEAFLRDVAQRTGGGHYAYNELDRLASAIPLPVSTEDEPVLLHLWHLPIFYALIVAALIAEWYLRRRKGQA